MGKRTAIPGRPLAAGFRARSLPLRMQALPRDAFPQETARGRGAPGISLRRKGGLLP